MIDIRDYPEIVDAVNLLLNNGLVAEVKREINRKDKTAMILVVEQYRVIKTRRILDSE